MRLERGPGATPARKEFLPRSTVGPTRKVPEAGSWRSTTRGGVTWDSVDNYSRRCFCDVPSISR